MGTEVEECYVRSRSKQLYIVYCKSSKTEGIWHEHVPAGMEVRRFIGPNNTMARGRSYVRCDEDELGCASMTVKK